MTTAACWGGPSGLPCSTEHSWRTSAGGLGTAPGGAQTRRLCGKPLGELAGLGASRGRNTSWKDTEDCKPLSREHLQGCLGTT